MEFQQSSPAGPPPPAPQLWLQRSKFPGLEFHPPPPPPPPLWLQRRPPPPGCNEDFEMSGVNPEIPKTEGKNTLPIPPVSLESKVKDGRRRRRRKKSSLLLLSKPKQESPEASVKPEENGRIISTKCSDEIGALMLKKENNKSKGKEMEDFAFWCEVCKVGADHENVMENHMKGKKHLKKLPQKEPAKVDHPSLVLVKKKTNSFLAFHEAFVGAVELMEELRQQTNDPEQERILKLRALGIIRVIGELVNQRILSDRIVHNIVQELLGDHEGSYPVKENVEALCKLFSTIGKQLDEYQVSRRVNEMPLNRLNDIVSKPTICPRLRFLIWDILVSHRRKWIYKREEVKAETITDGAMPQSLVAMAPSPSTGAPLKCSSALSVQRTCRWRRNSLPEELVLALCILCLVIYYHVMFTLGRLLFERMFP